jgi:hypothetical protein
MAKQTLDKWLLAIAASFNKAGAAAVAAGPVGAIAFGGVDIWHRVIAYVGFAAATWVVAGIHGAAAYIAKDSVPFDEETELENS